jgi:HAMP domain-containing protein
MDDNTMAVALVALIASGTVLSFFAFFIGRAWAERIRGAHRVAGGEGVKALREEMQGELQQLRHEVGELAERVDFTERLLTKQREAARLGPLP